MESELTKLRTTYDSTTAEVEALRTTNTVLKLDVGEQKYKIDYA